MKKRSKVRIFSFAAFLLLIMGGYMYQSSSMLVSSKTELEYGYRRALNDLTGYVTSMEQTLKKSEYANTATMRGDISSQLLEQSSGAKAAMAVLPFSQEKTEKISRFVSQVGDYAMSLSRKAATGGEINDEDFENLSNMQDYVTRLSGSLQEIQAHLSVDKANIGKTRSLLNNVDEIDQLPSFDDSMDEVAKEFDEFPELLYDGPFSDHIMQAESRFLKDKQELDIDKAKEIAAQFLDCHVKKLSENGTSETALSAYVFSCDDGKGTVHITKRGGQVSYFKKTMDIQNKNLDYEEALKLAGEFLKKNGINSFKESYYTINDNSCTINFSYLEEGKDKIVCYPDLIKVVVELDQGETVAYDATGYLMNHHEREIAPPSLSLDEARESVSKNLNIMDFEMAIIPTPGQDEVYCYEFKCKDKNGTEVLVYINAETGYEEQIFILTYSDHGILTF